MEQRFCFLVFFVNSVQAATLTVCASGCGEYTTIQAAITAAIAGDTINVAAGTYTEVGQIVISKNLSIVGAGKTTTIIKPNTDQSTAWFYVNGGVTFNLSKVTLDGTGRVIKCGVRYKTTAAGTVNDNIFTNLISTSTSGYAIGTELGTTHVDITNNTFTQIGRGGVWTKGNHGTVSGNTYTGKGAGDWFDYFIVSDYGDNMTISNNTISNNIGNLPGYTSGAIAIWDGAAEATITGNTMTNNVIGVAIVGYEFGGTTPKVVIGAGNLFDGGGIGVDIENYHTLVGEEKYSPDVTFTGTSTFEDVTESAINIWTGVNVETYVFSNLNFNNSAFGITNNGTNTLNAINNWWGTTQSLAVAAKISGNVTYAPFYVNAGKTILSNIATIATSTIGTLETNAIINIPFVTTVADFEAGISTVTGVKFDVYDSDGTTSATTLTDASLVKVISADGTVSKTYSIAVLAETQVAPDDEGEVTANSTTPQVVVVDPDQAVTVTVESGVLNPSIDLSSLVSGGTATLPQITVNTSTADFVIPSSTTVTSDPSGSSWDGVLAAPTVTTVTLPETSGESKTLGTAIELGFTGAKLSFDKPVRILIPGEKGKRAGYVRTGISFTEILSTCSGDVGEVLGVPLSVDQECKIDVGNDLVIWTRHFTKFATYSASSTSSSSSSSSSSTTTNAPFVCSATKPGSAPTLLSAVLGRNMVTLTWAKATSPVTKYLVAYGNSADSMQYGNPNVGGADTTSYVVRSLSGGSRYFFKVKAINDCMPGDFSNALSATPFGGVITVANTSTDVTSTETDTVSTAKDFVPLTEIPGSLFDIALNISSAVLGKASELNAQISFTSFGLTPTQVNMAYRIEDTSGKVMFVDSESVTVETEKVVVKEFPSLNLEVGKYTLLLTTTYGNNVVDEFKQTFEVKGTAGLLSFISNKWILIPLFLVIIGFIVWRVKRVK